MSEHSTIEWCEATWNPVRGCDKVSPGCAHCYAETFAERFRGVAGHPYEQGFDLRLVPEKLGEPQRWKKPRRVFVNSMSDLFHERVPDDYIAEVWKTMATIRRHTYQVLTKRAARMQALLPRLVATFGVLQNVWLGVSIENQHFADERIPLLLETPSAVRFISAEPLLGPIDFTLRGDRVAGWDEDWRYDVLSGEEWAGPRDEDPERSPHLDWVIVGGESGHEARPCALEWIYEIVRQCHAARVACFVKQLGAYVVAEQRRTDDGVWAWRAGLQHKKGGDPAEWPEALRVQQFPEARA